MGSAGCACDGKVTLVGACGNAAGDIQPEIEELRFSIGKRVVNNLERTGKIYFCVEVVEPIPADIADVDHVDTTSHLITCLDGNVTVTPCVATGDVIGVVTIVDGCGVVVAGSQTRTELDVGQGIGDGDAEGLANDVDGGVGGEIRSCAGEIGGEVDI